MNKLKLIINLNPFYDVHKRALLWKDELGSIGNNCQIFHKVSFGSEPYLIELGDNVKITYGCKFITHDGGLHTLREMDLLPNASVYGKINIGDNVFIGNDVIILPGVSVGNNCVIGAGSIVTKSIPSHSVAAGVPAKIISSIEEYHEKCKAYAIDTSKISQQIKKELLLEPTTSVKLIKK